MTRPTTQQRQYAYPLFSKCKRSVWKQRVMPRSLHLPVTPASPSAAGYTSVAAAQQSPSEWVHMEHYNDTLGAYDPILHVAKS